MSTEHVQNYLDCGCAIMSTGRRAWCPSCLAPQPPQSNPPFAVLKNAVVEATQLSGCRVYVEEGHHWMQEPGGTTTPLLILRADQVRVIEGAVLRVCDEAADVLERFPGYGSLITRLRTVAKGGTL